jgi:hypothetical protein
VTSSTTHSLEQKFNAPIVDILEAIEHGFRAQADVKGKLAELYLHRYLRRLQTENKIRGVQWYDADRLPDFEVLMVDGRKLRVECKNIRSNKAYSTERGCKVEIQKTRGGLDKKGRKTRGYMADHFDVLAACLFNQTGEWRFRFIAANRLACREGDPQILKIMQLVPTTGEDKYWSDDFLVAVENANH